MLIETQITPDVNVINFFPAEKVLRSGTAEFVDAKSLRKSPLAEAIFDLGGVRSVFLTSDMISVTKENNASWDDLKPQILAEIMDFFATGEQAVVENPADRSPENVIREITSLINARPFVRTAATSSSEVLKTVSYMSNCKATARVALMLWLH